MQQNAFGFAKAALLLLPTSHEAAAALLHGHVRYTPCQLSPRLSQLTGAEVYLKLENFQVTGSFKARGAAHKLLSLSESSRQAGVVAASSGNHGAGVAGQE